MSVDRSLHRAVLETLLARVRDGEPVTSLIAATLDARPLFDALAPIASAPWTIDSIDGHPGRVDAVVSADGRQWRVVFGSDGTSVEWLSVYERPQIWTGIDGGVLVVVNGPSGAGKSTLMRAMQACAAFPVVVLDEPEHVGTVQPGYLVWRDTAPTLHRGYLRAMTALAAEGNVVAVSAAGHGRVEFAETAGDVRLVTVGLRCEFGVLVAREQRTGRWAGIAAASLRVHDGWRYDLEFDTTDGPDPEVMARAVLALVEDSSSA